MLIVDAHLDLAMNAVMWNRDLTLSAHETREIEREAGMTEKGRCAGTVGSPICEPARSDWSSRP